ncbi:hypothetical protein SAMN04489718_3653 [Actinopolyspora saharensis]|uniref:Uncharacterized protein n=1 Tax=Actinopolyspora saharensis TaxID=995062 RepID=A0A1H1GHE1_9ACTN|nr:hypothetical protein SAMN04489718_3653 [Actinopolyspora saharensis]
MNDSRSRFLTQLILPFGVGIVVALLHRWGHSGMAARFGDRTGSGDALRSALRAGPARRPEETRTPQASRQRASTRAPGQDIGAHPAPTLPARAAPVHRRFATGES